MKQKKEKKKRKNPFGTLGEKKMLKLEHFHWSAAKKLSCKWVRKMDCGVTAGQKKNKVLIKIKEVGQSLYQ